MSTNEAVKYFDLHTNGLGYLSRVREVTPREGEPFLAVTLAALRGNAEEAQYTYFECRVSGRQAQHVVRELKAAVRAEKKVLVGFLLSDLYPELYTVKNGARAGERGVNLKARLLRIGWAKVNGEPLDIEQRESA